MTSLEDLHRQTELLLATARALTDASAPSLCVGWTRGHVLAHLARNADGLAALARAAVDGTGETMYRSDEERDADIDAGADRPLPELLADLESTAAMLRPLLARLGPEHADITLERTPGGQRFTAGRLLDLRVREVVYHHVDLDAGFTFADVDPDLVRVYLDGEYANLGPDAGHRARAQDLLWRARGLRSDP